MTPCARPIIFAASLAVALSGCSNEAKDNAAPDILPDMPTLAVADTAPISVADEAAFRDVSVEQANALISGATPATVLDVRTPGEFAEGHIEGAINIDVTSDTFVEDLAKLDKGKAYVVHCRSGRRSAKALEAMKEARFENVAHMNEGMIGWTGAGLPVAQ